MSKEKTDFEKLQLVVDIWKASDEHAKDLSHLAPLVNKDESKYKAFMEGRISAYAMIENAMKKIKSEEWKL